MQGGIKLIKNDNSKDIYNVTKEFCFINALLLNISSSRKKEIAPLISTKILSSTVVLNVDDKNVS